jgi:hypothetical protein
MTPKSELPSLLSAASLLFSLIAFLYGLSYAKLRDAEGIELGGRQKADLGPERRHVRAARRTAIFAAVVASIVAVVFLPSAIELSRHFFERLDEGRQAFDSYNAVATTLVLVTVGCLVVAGHATWMATRLSGTLRRLS